MTMKELSDALDAAQQSMEDARLAMEKQLATSNKIIATEQARMESARQVYQDSREAAVNIGQQLRSQLDQLLGPSGSVVR